MSAIRDTAEKFFDACETGKGWDGCKQYCRSDATFSAQADALTGIGTVEGYTNWMKGMFSPLPDAQYEVRSFAVDEQRNNVAAFGVFRGTNTGPGPVPANRQARRSRLRVRDGFRERPNQARHEDLE